MKQVLFFSFFLISTALFSQKPTDLDGRWSYAGSRVLKFVVNNNNLYVTFIKDHDYARFDKFYNNQPVVDSNRLFRLTTKIEKGKLYLYPVEKFDSKDRPINFIFIYDKLEDSTLYISGDVFEDTTRIRYTNENCDLANPTCKTYLYKRKDITKIKKLKSLHDMTREDVLALFKRLETVVPQLCNRCNEGFPIAAINRVVHLMGYNPIITKRWNDEVVYSPSALSFLMDKFVGRIDDPKDKELKDHYQNIIVKFLQEAD